MSSRSGHIDALRGFAILLVIQFHLFSTTGAYATLGVPDMAQRVLAYGWAGVDLFFVLSAYLLMRNLLKATPSSGTVGRFYLRRALRILPLYWLLLALGFAGAALLDLDLRSWLWRDRYAPQTYLLFLQNLDYGLVGHPGAQVFAPTWSLAVEEHFYLVLPVLALGLPRRALLGLAAAAVLCTPLLRHLVETRINPVAAYVWTPCRLDSFGWGILIAVLQERLDPWAARHRRLLLAAAATLAVTVAMAMPVVRPGETNGLVAITAMALCAAATTLACVTRMPARALARPWALLHAGLRWAGARCFSLYLLHMPLLGLTFLAVGLPAPYGGKAAGVVLIGAASC